MARQKDGKHLGKKSSSLQSVSQCMHVFPADNGLNPALYSAESSFLEEQ